MSPHKMTKVSAKNDPKSSKDWSEKASQTSCAKKKYDFSLPDATWHRFWLSRRAPRRSRALALGSWGALGRSRGAPETSQDAAKTPRNSSWNALGRHRPSGEAPAIDFRLICDALKLLPGRLLDRFGSDPLITCLDVGCPGRSTCHRSGLFEVAWLPSNKPND